LATVDPIAIAFGMVPALERGVDGDLEVEVFGYVFGRVVDTQVEAARFRIAQVDNRFALRHQYTFFGIQVGDQPLNARNDFQRGLAGFQATGQIEMDLAIVGYVLDANRDASLALGERRAYRRGQIDRGEIAGDLDARRVSRASLAIGVGDLIVALALEHA